MRADRLLRAALAAAALSPAAAGAHRAPRRPVFSSPVSAAMRRAASYWHGTPCGGTVKVLVGNPEAAPPAGENAPDPVHIAAMWAEWETPAGRNLFSQPPATFSDCVVFIDPAIWPGRAAEDSDFPAFCKEMLHEYGHFEGVPDVGQAPGTIAYERPDLAHVPLCERYRLWYGFRLYEGPPRRRPLRGRSGRG